MSIEGKHAYRFEYLKSEQWQAVRLEALVREGGKCQICEEESISNDAHHIWYPDSMWDTTPEHLVILCRPCHDFIHAMMPDCKTRDEAIGREKWISFRNAIEIWRIKKNRIFEEGIGAPVKAKDLRLAYENLKKKVQILQESSIPGEATTEEKLNFVLRLIKTWAKEVCENEKRLAESKLKE